MLSEDRVEVAISVDSKIWAEFEQTYAQWYQSRKRHPRRPSYAALRKQAVDEAFRDYVTKLDYMLWSPYIIWPIFDGLDGDL